MVSARRPCNSGQRRTATGSHLPPGTLLNRSAARIPGTRRRTRLPPGAVKSSWIRGAARGNGGACRPKPLVTGGARAFKKRIRKRRALPNISVRAEQWQTRAAPARTVTEIFLDRHYCGTWHSVDFLVDIRIRGHSGPPRRPILLSGRNTGRQFTMRRILFTGVAFLIATAGITLAPAISASAQASCTGTLHPHSCVPVVRWVCGLASPVDAWAAVATHQERPPRPGPPVRAPLRAAQAQARGDAERAMVSSQ
jgi:hypothetical protein